MPNSQTQVSRIGDAHLSWSHLEEESRAPHQRHQFAGVHPDAVVYQLVLEHCQANPNSALAIAFGSPTIVNTERWWSGSTCTSNNIHLRDSLDTRGQLGNHSPITALTDIRNTFN